MDSVQLAHLEVCVVLRDGMDMSHCAPAGGALPVRLRFVRCMGGGSGGGGAMTGMSPPSGGAVCVSGGTGMLAGLCPASIIPHRARMCNCGFCGGS